MLFFVALFVARLVRIISRLRPSGQGTTLPGLLALKIDKRFIENCADRIGGKVIIVAGTNGKTTTSRALSTILKQDGNSVIANSAGANLPSGIASACARSLGWGASKKTNYAIFEVDEHVLAKITIATKPSLIIFTNLFRDQLDRYGEIDSIAKKWLEAIKTDKREYTLVVNGNDARLVRIAESQKRKSIYFGVDDGTVLGPPNVTAADSTICPNCDARLAGNRFMAHLGVLRCSQCDYALPELDIVIKGFDSTANGSRIVLGISKEKLVLNTNLSGRFNAFNVAAAVAAAKHLGVGQQAVRKGVQNISKAFGRAEHFMIGNKKVTLHLAKNPTGYNEVLISLLDREGPLDLLLVLNDNWADGQDISWIWDVNFEDIISEIDYLAVAGQRAGDLAVRLDTAGFIKDISVTEDLDQSFDNHLAKSSNELDIIASYSAMIYLRQFFASRNYLSNKWE